MLTLWCRHLGNLTSWSFGELESWHVYGCLWMFMTLFYNKVTMWFFNGRGGSITRQEVVCECVTLNLENLMRRTWFLIDFAWTFCTFIWIYMKLKLFSNLFVKIKQKRNPINLWLFGVECSSLYKLSLRTQDPHRTKNTDKWNHQSTNQWGYA